MSSLYRRPLPAGQVAFASSEGRALFREALALGTLEGFFPLIEQFHTQAEPAFCGLGSLVMALNAFGIDPGRLWRGPWRWFSEELLDCCTPLDSVRQSGIALDELACLARCNGADARVERPSSDDPSQFRAVVEAAARSAADVAVIASYSRADLDQSGSGHFSPIGGYHPARDLVLVLDVARFKYPPHWVPLSALYAAMIGVDETTGRSRGWIELRRRGAPSSIAYFVSCAEGMGIGAGLAQLVSSTRAELVAVRPQARADVIRAVARTARDGRLAACFSLRRPATPEHERLLGALRDALASSAVYRAVAAAVTETDGELLTAWLLAAPDEMWADLPAELAADMRLLVATSALPVELAVEAAHVRTQVQYLLEYARTAGSATMTRAAAGSALT